MREACPVRRRFPVLGQAYDILPRNIYSKLSFNIRIIRALVSASWF
ncbi:MAG: hypothetical protein ACXW3N_03440 [Rhodoplanes sp.]